MKPIRWGASKGSGRPIGTCGAGRFSKGRPIDEGSGGEGTGGEGVGNEGTTVGMGWSRVLPGVEVIVGLGVGSDELSCAITH